MTDRPGFLEDPFLYSDTTIMEKDGITTEVLSSTVDEFKALGYTVVGPGQPRQQTSFTDKKKVDAFNSTKRFFWNPPSRH